MDKVLFRAARLSDLPILYSFEQGIIEAERPFDPTLKAGHINYYDIKAMIQSEDVEVLVALIEDELVASSYIKIKKAEPYLDHIYYGYIGFMYVKPNYRGRGISTKMIAELSSWAKKKNLSEVRLDVYDQNLSAIKAYKKAGLEKHMVEMRLKI